jgi:hypothetical protein
MKEKQSLEEDLGNQIASNRNLELQLEELKVTTVHSVFHMVYGIPIACFFTVCYEG